jgi:hypothetical protein
LAEAYLNSRHIDITGLPTAALRYHPRCIFGRATCTLPYCALCNALTDKPSAIHRIRLALDSKKVDRLSLGPIKRRS